MALKQVGARTEGDVYQGLFFWRQAADLLNPDSMVARVVLEHDEADGVDDVAVFYRAPGVHGGAEIITADYYQLKYHVDNSKYYCSDALIDPKFINAKSSLLQRFYKAYANLTGEHTQIRLHLASNWRWQQDDVLAKLLREYDGALPDKFFEGGPKSDLGKIREKWRTHLELDADKFITFSRALRLQLDHFGRRYFKDLVYASLKSVGLRVPSADHAACPYESLVQQFLMNGPNSFDEKAMRDLCKREGLLNDITRPRPLSIGVRSFVRFAERLESDVDQFVCVAANFKGRLPRTNESWEKSASELSCFFADTERRANLRATESIVALECHGSLAFLAGWELSRNSGVNVAPIQKPNLQVWRPSDGATSNAAWEFEVLDICSTHEEIALCISATHDIKRDVTGYISNSSNSPSVGRIALFSPKGGPSPQSIKDADHAYTLAVKLPGLLAAIRTNHRTLIHVFFACPNALMFFIGQQREALGRVALYEFDFGIERSEPYQHSISLPLQTHSF